MCMFLGGLVLWVLGSIGYCSIGSYWIVLDRIGSYWIMVFWFWWVFRVPVFDISVVSWVLACIVQWFKRFKNESQFKYQTAEQCTGALVKKRRWESIVLYAFLATEEMKSPSANGATLSSICPAFTTCKHLWTCCYTPDLWYRRTLCQPISTCTLKGQTSAKQLNTWSSRLIHGNLLGSWGHQLLW